MYWFKENIYVLFENRIVQYCNPKLQWMWLGQQVYFHFPVVHKNNLFVLSLKFITHSTMIVNFRYLYTKGIPNWRFPLITAIVCRTVKCFCSNLNNNAQKKRQIIQSIQSKLSISQFSQWDCMRLVTSQLCVKSTTNKIVGTLWNKRRNHDQEVCLHTNKSDKKVVIERAICALK